MDPITALGVASAVVQFVIIGIRVGEVLKEYTSTLPGDVPKSLESISTQLPLICHALSRIKTENEVKRYDTDICVILNGVILGCTKLVVEVEGIAAKIQPEPGENLKVKLRKVFDNIKYGQRIDEIDRGLQAYAQVLILHQVVDRAEVQVVSPAQTDYFEVKEKRVEEFTRRDELMTRLDECFYRTTRSQTRRPESIVLQGVAKSGKTQLALEFSHQTYNSKQFRTIFWLDSRNPEVLRLGLENTACVIRQTKTGTREEKIAFVIQFLADRWHPWLLVLDGYDPKTFADEPLVDFLPNSGCGAILVTSRFNAQRLRTRIKIPRYVTAAEEDDRRHAVCDAVRSRDIQFIKESIDDGFNVNSNSVTIWKPQAQPMINLAAQLGFDDIVGLFLENGANPCLNRSTGHVLGTTAYYNSIPVMTTYLDFEDKSGHRADASEYLHAIKTVIVNNHEDVFKLLVLRRPDMSWAESREVGEGFAKAAENGHTAMLHRVMSIENWTIPTITMATALTDATYTGKVEVVSYLLSEAKCDPNVLDETGRLPLYEATQVRDEAVRKTLVELLTTAGASAVARRTSDQRTPLHSAALYGYSPIVAIFLRDNPDITVRDDEGQTPLAFAAHSVKDVATYTLLTNAPIADTAARKAYFENSLTIAAQKGDRDLAMLVLKQLDTTSIRSSEVKNALLTVIKNKHTSIARMLIRKGVGQDARDKDGRPLLVLAAENGLDLVIRDLVKATDSPGIEVHDLAGITPLMSATKANHKSTVETCLKLGADVDAVNEYGETAEDIAEESGLTEILELLQKSGI